jgi:hypothetical protein
MTKQPRVEFRVSFTLPPGATVARAKEFVESAVRAEVGICHPSEDPMHELDRDSVTVTRILKHTRRSALDTVENSK